MFPSDLPPISNKPLYVYRVFAKWLCFSLFGLGCIILAVFFLPAMRLVFYPKARFQKFGRRFISRALRFFVLIMRGVGMADLEPDNREKYRNLSSKIVVANHPSFIDPAMLISLIPNADTIFVFFRNNLFLGGIIRQLYILGSRELDIVIQDCIDSLNNGNCLLIFPEGRRTRRSSKVILKKGTARIALASGRSIVPVHIGGTDKFGLGRGEWAGYNPTERYAYRLKMGEEISPEKYRHLPATVAAKLLTEEIASSLFPTKA